MNRLFLLNPFGIHLLRVALDQIPSILVSILLVAYPTPGYNFLSLTATSIRTEKFGHCVPQIGITLSWVIKDGAFSLNKVWCIRSETLLRNDLILCPTELIIQSLADISKVLESLQNWSILIFLYIMCGLLFNGFNTLILFLL